MFKKKSLKFTYEKVSRDVRHGETLKARENSRFKRLSMIRNIDSDFNDESMETSKENECKEPPKSKPSRLEMLFKWKKEKEIKKEMEKLAKKKPFYVGSNKNALDNKNLQNFKSSFIAQPNSSFNSSKLTKSKIGTPNATVPSSRIQTSKQGISRPTTQSSSIPNSKQGATTTAFKSSKVPNSKLATPSTTFQSSRIPNNKQIGSLTKPGSSNSTVTLSRKFPVSSSTIDKTGLQKPGSILSRSNSTAANSRKYPVPASTVDKAASVSKVVTNQRVPSFNKTPNNISSDKSKDLSKPFNRVGTGLAKLAPTATKLAPTTTNLAPTTTKLASTATKLANNTTKLTSSGTKLTSNVIAKGIPKMPVSSLNKKFGSNPKLNQKETSQTKDIVPSRKGYCFKAAANSSRQRNEILQGTPKKLQLKNPKDEEKSSGKEFFEQSLDKIPDLTFNSDISMIKPARPSFAPANFTFRPPEGLGDFVFEEDDIYQTLEEVKLKFMSRTSTPSKNSGRNSSITNSKELVTPEKDRINNGKTGEIVNKQTCYEPVACTLVASIEISDADDVVNQEACEELASISPVKCDLKEIDAVEDEQAWEKLADSPINTEIKEDNETKNQQTSEETVSDVTRDLNKAEPAEKKCLLGENKSFGDFDKNENVEENTDVVGNGVILEESLSNCAFANGVFLADARQKDAFLDIEDEDSFLDSIDLNKMELMKLDDDESDEDDVLSPQNFKCPERKSNGAVSKRTSMLKSVSIMNSIAETVETDDCNSVSPLKENQDICNTPRRSKRILNSHQRPNTLNNFLINAHVDSPSSAAVTPRRSLRLMKKVIDSDINPSPSEEKKTSNVNPRRSMRLIDLNSPKKAVNEMLCGENFENMDPNSFLIDFESPTMLTIPKSKKVSLLYSPEKRKSIRKSIRGDLMSFSPSQ